ncbi:DUF5615 family PIN-like protein [Dyadobacter sp. CY312]|uniref:DUF5615 family PIN-like protein n=1 Tax=Dyadobacter sp. CY312 TaxID=2907303 RepID=UPI001F178895|nr:DUF5615 family PIN-like protein [Dyadobacter sp. CY312]MCE7042968.1 DUF5615 family PIN-like protein [Dyadobacter sp. CY312]
MKFLVDAQLPYLLAQWIRDKGFEVVHTDDLPAKDETEDREIRLFADANGFIVITKDSDFLDSYILKSSPRKMLLITTGNIKNKALLDLFRLNFQELINLLAIYDLIEMSNTQITAHE